MPDIGISLKVISIDREILLMIFPFEIDLKNERLRGILECRNDGRINFLWQTKSKIDLDEKELHELAFCLLQEYESQSEAETRESVKQELVNIILNAEA